MVEAGGVGYRDWVYGEEYVTSDVFDPSQGLGVEAYVGEEGVELVVWLFKCLFVAGICYR